MNKITIGKTPNNDIVISDDLTVSRSHAELILGEEMCIVDLNSTNGTYVNGMRINRQQKLNPLDVVRVGNSLVDWNSFSADKTVIDFGLAKTIAEDKEELIAVEPKQIESRKVEKDKFYWGGFILGFFLTLLGVILAYIFSRDSNFRNSVWKGFLARVIVMLISLA